MKNKKDLVIQSALSEVTKFQLHSNDEKFFNWIEELRQYIIDFESDSFECKKCGCTEFLCGHNKKK